MRGSDELKLFVLLMIAVGVAGLVVHARVDLGMSLAEINLWLDRATGTVVGLVVVLWLQLGVAFGMAFGARVLQLKKEQRRG